MVTKLKEIINGILRISRIISEFGYMPDLLYVYHRLLEHITKRLYKTDIKNIFYVRFKPYSGYMLYLGEYNIRKSRIKQVCLEK